MYYINWIKMNGFCHHYNSVMIIKDKKRGLSKLYVCNYGPGGNFVGVPMYKIGFPGKSP